MNSNITKAMKYFKKAESFMNESVLYITVLYKMLINQMEIMLQKAEPYFDLFYKQLNKARGFVMYLFLEDLISNIKRIYDKADFFKPRPISSKYGIAYVFLIVIALNLTGFNVLLTGSSEINIPSSGASILNTVKNEGNKSGVEYNHVAELEIFQQIIRHSDMDQHLALKLASIINNESQKYGLDPYLILSVIQVESRFSPKALSHKGARGLMQVMPTTGRYVANKYDLPLKNSRALFDPVTNIRLGIAYLSYLENMYGNMDYALFAYNHGPKKSKQIKKTFSKSKPYYVKAVMNFKEFLETERQVTES